ncbi:hypothetical protein [Paenibacillus antarcticus]|uniref:Late embryogenesis abundant protein LEA-2 subgroup domain-containing protein n=1 Tax=Paenibacillus antarcticus TaxID=253703 RepID=A0A162M971_9BACL|nr:hypothetical protein [Paenibacillus antarcticus]OAB40373.1 hypothetical protein PBAT_24040 [Paenibacillus antarcticus]
MKKTKLLTISILIVIVIMTLSFFNLNINYHGSAVYVSSSVASLEQLEVDANILHSLTYEVNITNTNKRSTMVKNLKANFSNSVLSRVESGDIVVKINKKLKPDETITIKGKFEINVSGSTDEEIIQEAKIEFEVESEQYNILKFW